MLRFPSTTRARVFRRANAVRLTALFGAALLLSGCVAEMVDKEKPRKGPVPEVGYIDVGGGEIRYSTEGWGWIVASRRMTALHRINHFCRKDLRPKIVDEFTHDDVDTPYAGMDAEDDLTRGLEHYEVAPYHHIVFECRPKAGVVTVDELAAAKTVKTPPPKPAPTPAPAPAPQTPKPGEPSK